MIAIYARQSVDKKDSISIDMQIETCLKRIDPVHIYKVYSDKGYSGSNINRPRFEEMMKDIENGNVEQVIVYKLDRISRSLLDFAQIWDTFSKRQVEFLSCSEQFDTSTPMGRAMLGIIMIFAQLERETIQMRIKDNYYARGAKGLYLGGRPPYGYSKVKTTYKGIKTHKYEIDEKQAELMKMLFKKYAKPGTAFGPLVKKINGMGLKTNRGKPWSGVVLGRLIRNPAFVRANADVYQYYKSKGTYINNSVEDFIGVNGCYLYAERDGVKTMKYTDLSKSFLSIAPHEGIIDSETWLLCQYKAEKNQALKNTGKGTYTWLTGLMKCGYCGMHVIAVKGRNSLLYTTCGGRRRYICTRPPKTIYIKKLEQIVEVKLLEKLKNLKVRGTNEKNMDNRKLDALKSQLVTIEEKIESLVSSLIDMSEGSAKYVDAKITELDKQKSVVQAQINEVMRSGTKREFSDQDLQEYIDNWAGYSLEQKKGVAKSVIDRVVVKNDEILIDFKI